MTRVLVPLAHVVRLVPYYFVENNGTRMVTTVEGEGKKRDREGLNRSFYVYDVLGAHYDSGSASPAGQALLERMWEESA